MRRCLLAETLFPVVKRPRRRSDKPKRVLMRLIDAGDHYRSWVCVRCGFEVAAHYDREMPVSYNEPCPRCGATWGSEMQHHTGRPGMPPKIVRDALVMLGASSPCAKSKRACIAYRPATSPESPTAVLAKAVNAPPKPLVCADSERCRASCRDVAVHAEVAVLLDLQESGISAKGLDLVHLKVRDGKPVPSGKPSCARCSTQLLAAGVAGVWLLHEDNMEFPWSWRRYDALKFHRLSMRANKLPWWEMTERQLDPEQLRRAGHSTDLNGARVPDFPASWGCDEVPNV